MERKYESDAEESVRDHSRRPSSVGRGDIRVISSLLVAAYLPYGIEDTEEVSSVGEKRTLIN